MPLGSQRVRVAGSALATRHFMLLYAAMLVAAAGNTALQSVMPAIGREIGLSDLWVTLSYTWSAVLWVALAPYWARKSDFHGRKALTLLGVGGFIASMLLCGLVLFAGLHGGLAAGVTFALFAVCRSLYGSLGCATPSATQAYLASRTRRSARVAALSSLSSSFGLGTIVGPALAPLFVLPFLGLSGPLFAFAAIGLVVWLAIFLGLPDDKKPRHGRRAGQGAAMSYPSLASSPTGASVIAATAPKVPLLKWHDMRIRNWIVAGVIAGHAQAATLSCIGFFVIDRLALAPRGGFGIASLGFGFTRPGFTGGASLAVPLHQQGGVAGVVTAANGIAYVAAPGVGMALYAIDPHFPFVVSAILLVGLIVWGRRRLALPTPSAD